jgi:hypothetical protein
MKIGEALDVPRTRPGTLSDGEEVVALAPCPDNLTVAAR